MAEKRISVLNRISDLQKNVHLSEHTDFAVYNKKNIMQIITLGEILAQIPIEMLQKELESRVSCKDDFFDDYEKSTE